MKVLDLASTLSVLSDVRREAPWSDQEYVKGWAVFGLPFDSGQVLALRVMTESNLAPYRSLYHRDPAGRWSLYIDGPRICTCSRHYGSACELTGQARIQVQWTGPATVQVTVDRPRIEWTFTATSDLRLGLLNAVNGALPLATWRPAWLLRARERAAQSRGLGRLRLSGIAPSGSREILMPARVYFIDESDASVEGVDLGRPTHHRENPLLGSMALPARGVLAVGQAMWQIDDAAAFEGVRQGLGLPAAQEA